MCCMITRCLPLQRTKSVSSSLSQAHACTPERCSIQRKCVCFRDVFTVRLTPGKQVTNAQASIEAGVPYVCPVTGLSCLRYPFTALPDCGHVFSSRAVAQVCLCRPCLPALPPQLVSVFQQTAALQHGQSCASSVEPYVLAALSQS